LSHKSEGFLENILNRIVKHGTPLSHVFLPSHSPLMASAMQQ